MTIEDQHGRLSGTTGMVKDKYDEIAPSWREQVWVHDTELKRRIVELANIDNSNATLLDVGTGAGDLAGLFNISSVTGVDISQAMLNEGKKIHPDFNFILGDAEMLPLNDNSYDVVCSRNLLQNFNDSTKAFKEMTRVLKKGGLLLVVESAVDEEERGLATSNLRVVEPYHPLLPSHQMLLKLFEDNGLEEIRHDIIGIHKRWLAKWCVSKQATEEQKLEIYKQCENSPEWYKKKYGMKLYPEETEIEVTLPFSILTGKKK